MANFAFERILPALPFRASSPYPPANDSRSRPIAVKDGGYAIDVARGGGSGDRDRHPPSSLGRFSTSDTGVRGSYGHREEDVRWRSLGSDSLISSTRREEAMEESTYRDTRSRTREHIDDEHDLSSRHHHHRDHQDEGDDVAVTAARWRETEIRRRQQGQRERERVRDRSPPSVSYGKTCGSLPPPGPAASVSIGPGRVSFDVDGRGEKGYDHAPASWTEIHRRNDWPISPEETRPPGLDGIKRDWQEGRRLSGRGGGIALPSFRSHFPSSLELDGQGYGYLPPPPPPSSTFSSSLPASTYPFQSSTRPCSPDRASSRQRFLHRDPHASRVKVEVVEVEPETDEQGRASPRLSTRDNSSIGGSRASSLLRHAKMHNTFTRPTTTRTGSGEGKGSSAAPPATGPGPHRSRFIARPTREKEKVPTDRNRTRHVSPLPESSFGYSTSSSSTRLPSMEEAEDRSGDGSTKVGETSPPAAAERLDSGAIRRLAHLKCEQRRRESINGGFAHLRSILVESTATDSKAIILQKAIHYIQSLEQIVRASEHTGDRLGVISPPASTTSPDGRTRSHLGPRLPGVVFISSRRLIKEEPLEDEEEVVVGDDDDDDDDDVEMMSDEADVKGGGATWAHVERQ